MATLIGWTSYFSRKRRPGRLPADLRSESESNPLIAHANLLFGFVASGRDTLHCLADLGVDDALLICPFDDPGQLEGIRALYP